MHACTRTHAYTRIHTHTHAYTRIHTHTHAYIRIHTHTHSYTRRRAQSARGVCSRGLLEVRQHVRLYGCLCLECRAGRSRPCKQSAVRIFSKRTAEGRKQCDNISLSLSSIATSVESITSPSTGPSLPQCPEMFGPIQRISCPLVSYTKTRPLRVRWAASTIYTCPLFGHGRTESD
jgi:hypothetical protein